ncbi:undecaprenyl diphosphate synthase [Catalinimonas alkaloidigena]|uniref:Isoprenyl transferase n=1 Tax=Catalinimonas alkaloidigena TaxID=1075417 RepID=A0A1G9DV38_9BACT|nr:isoprenyl transferase [Catalinimonas alkaloidigena]SDK67700.1 undecaprenyl diphosphate synthase [Catalinimonas alkaloidigena]
MNGKDRINQGNLPRHIAVIMDGNGRWAKKRGAMRVFGHRNAIKAVRETVEGCAELGVEFLTLYAFSTENWGRPQEEVDALMQLLVSTIRNELPTLQKNKIRLATIGHTERLPKACQQELHEAIQLTSSNDRMTLVLALNYSGRWEIMDAVRQLAREVEQKQLLPDDIDEAVFRRALNSSAIPDPELLIRTSGEMRISNFFLWQMAYTELFITEVLWPDFRKQHLHEAILAYQKRERRFGLVTENSISPGS